MYHFPVSRHNRQEMQFTEDNLRDKVKKPGYTAMLRTWHIWWHKVWGYIEVGGISRVAAYIEVR